MMDYPECDWCGECDWCRKPVAEEGNPFQTFTMECAFIDVDPDVLGLLTGGLMGTPQSRTFAIEVFNRVPVRRRAWRVVWEWLTRTPRQYTEHYYYIPNARVVSGNDQIGD